MKDSRGRLAGRRVVITGVSRGVGFETALLFLEEGAEVLGVARNRANLAKANAVLRTFGKAYSSARADLSRTAAAALVAKAVRRRWGALDLLINNAAVNFGGKSFMAEKEAWLEETLRTNAVAPYRLTRALLPFLLKGRSPRVISVSSGAGTFHSVKAGGDNMSYRLSKWALNGLVMLLAAEFRDRISFIALDPGWVRTDMGGAGAPNLPSMSARRALDAALQPDHVTGRFLAGVKELDW